MWQKILRWYRHLPIFNYYRGCIDRWSDALREETRRANNAEDELATLRARMDEWIGRAEGSRYKQLYQDLKNKPHHLEAHANKQAKMLNWIGSHLALSYPNILEQARRKTNGPA